MEQLMILFCRICTWTAEKNWNSLPRTLPQIWCSTTLRKFNVLSEQLYSMLFDVKVKQSHWFTVSVICTMLNSVSYVYTY